MIYSQTNYTTGQVSEYWCIFEKIIAQQTYNKNTQSSLSIIKTCSCGFIYAAMGIQDIESGEISYTVPPGWYDKDGIDAYSILGLTKADNNIDRITFSCCNGYGIASVGQGASPKINYGTPTTAEFDDGTIATAIWSSYTLTDCDGENPEEFFYIDRWEFSGSDGVSRSVKNTWNGSPEEFVGAKGHPIGFHLRGMPQTHRLLFSV